MRLLSFGADPLYWISFIYIGEMACSRPAWCTHGLTLTLDGLALGVLYSFWFDFDFCNSYGHLIRRKGLLIFSFRFFSSSVLCRSNWLTVVDLSNSKSAFDVLFRFSSRSCLTARKFISLICPFSSLCVRAMV